MMINSVYPIFLLILCEGLMGGAVYANAFYRLQQDSHPAHREFLMGSAAVADTAGISLAGFTGMFLESAIRKKRGW